VVLIIASRKLRVHVLHGIAPKSILHTSYEQWSILIRGINLISVPHGGASNAGNNK